MGIVGKVLEMLIKFGGPLMELLAKLSLKKEPKKLTIGETLEHVEKIDREVSASERADRELFDGETEAGESQ